MSATATRAGIEYRYLGPTDPLWRVLDQEHDARGIDRLDRSRVRVFAATDEHGASSFFWLELKMFTSLILHPDHRVDARDENSALVNLVAMAQALIEQHLVVSTEVYIVADAPATQKMCESIHAQRIKSPVYRKIISKPGSNGRH